MENGEPSARWRIAGSVACESNSSTRENDVVLSECIAIYYIYTIYTQNSLNVTVVAHKPAHAHRIYSQLGDVKHSLHMLIYESGSGNVDICLYHMSDYFIPTHQYMWCIYINEERLLHQISVCISTLSVSHRTFLPQTTIILKEIIPIFMFVFFQKAFLIYRQ